MTGLVAPADWSGWTGPSADPNDEQFGDVIEPASLPEAGDYEAVIVGEPYDGAVVGRPGARAGPAALREALAATKTHRFGTGPVGRLADLGDVAALADAREPRHPGDDADAGFDPADAPVGAVQERVAEVASAVHATDAVPVFLGGDNSLTYPNVAPLLAEGNVGVVNVDAHLDVREVRGDPTSGTPYRQLFEAGLDAYACVGARHFETSTAYADYVRERGGTVVTAEAVGADLDAAFDRLREALSDVGRVYVSVDLDVLDAPAAPGVSAPTPGGLPTRELYRLLRRLAGGDRVAGFEVVECAPPLDEGGRTAVAGARAVAHFLSGHEGGDDA